MDWPDRDTLTRAVGDCASAITVFDKSSNIDVYRSVARIVFCNAGSMNPSGWVQWHSVRPGPCGQFSMIQERVISSS